MPEPVIVIEPVIVAVHVHVAEPVIVAVHVHVHGTVAVAVIDGCADAPPPALSRC